ncbi:UNVERIFIED_CONTAM: hypothetical protein GTU68_055640 [Idotea baltica]|nr:hypothetical protein [Idotea baltica]
MKQSIARPVTPASTPWTAALKQRDYLGKRAFDLVFAVLLLPVLVPVIAVLWLAVRLDGGPGFYGHLRVGRNGQFFRCWKLRSMGVDADARLTAHLAANPAAAAEWARDFKLTDDPRITPLGRILRKTSLDELPQIWNVLKGEMSFVGLRPITEDELEKYGPFQDLYLSLRPGITGPWQVEGRGNRVSYDARVAMDIGYGSRVSFTRDLGLIWRTIGVVFKASGE